MATPETHDGATDRSHDGLFQQSAVAAKGAEIAVIGVKGDAVDILPKLDGNPTQHLVGSQFERFILHVAVFTSAADPGQGTLIGYQLNSVDVVTVPNRHSR